MLTHVCACKHGRSHTDIYICICDFVSVCMNCAFFCMWALCMCLYVRACVFAYSCINVFVRFYLYGSMYIVLFFIYFPVRIVFICCFFSKRRIFTVLTVTNKTLILIWAGSRTGFLIWPVFSPTVNLMFILLQSMMLFTI